MYSCKKTRKVPCKSCALPTPRDLRSCTKVSVHERHRDCLEVWLQTIDVNCVFEKTVTPLMIQLDTGLPHVECGVTATPLMVAAEYDFPHIVKILIESGAEVDKFCHNVTALYYAVLRSNGECVDILLNSGSTRLLADCIFYGRGILLERASSSGWEHILKILIKEGTNVNQIDNTWTLPPIMMATANDHVECVKVLLEAGAQVNITNTTGNTALHTTRSARCVQLLLEGGGDINKVSTISHHSPLHWAYNPECAKVMLEAGANINLEGDNSTTPLVTAMYTNRCGVTRFLLDNLANVTPMAMMTAAELPYPCHLQLLIKHGADVNMGMNRRGSVLHVAASHDNSQHIKMLLKAGALINTYDKFDTAPLIAELRFEWLQDAKALMFAAGERLCRINQGILPDIMAQDRGIDLTQICRQSIRSHLLQINEQENLFSGVHKLGLPHRLREYLLYDMSLEI